MPLYCYECSACSHAFEELQGSNDPILVTCPECKQEKLTKVFGMPNAICRSKPKTIGQLAAENTRQLVMKHGAEKAKQIIHEKSYGKGGKKVKVPKGGTALPKQTDAVVEVPWWRTGEVNGTGPRSDTPIDVSTIKNPDKFILTGQKE